MGSVSRRKRRRGQVRRAGPEERARYGSTRILMVKSRPKLLKTASQTQNLTCITCKKNMKTVGALKAHTKSCLRFKCMFCGELYKTKCGLSGHQSHGKCHHEKEDLRVTKRKKPREVKSLMANDMLTTRRVLRPMQEVAPVRRTAKNRVMKIRLLDATVVNDEAQCFTETCTTLITGRKRQEPSSTVLNEHSTFFKTWLHRMSSLCDSRSLRTCYVFFHNTLRARLSEIKSLSGLYKTVRIAIHVNKYHNDLWFDQEVFQEAETLWR